MFRNQRAACAVLIIVFTTWAPTLGQQDNLPGSAEVIGSARVQFQGGNVTDLQSQLAAATKVAVEEIQNNPANLDSALQNLLTILGNSVIQILVEILQDGTVNAPSQSQQIAFQVGQSLDTISTSATGQLAQLDSNAVQRELQQETFNTLNEVQPETQTQDLIQQLANQVIQTVGNALASTLGLEFRANVEIADQEAPIPTASPSASTGEISTQEILIQLQEGNGTRAAEILNELLLNGQNQEVVDLFVNAFGDSTLEGQLELLLFVFYGTQDFLAPPLSVALEQVYTQRQDALAQLLSRVIISLDGNASLVPTLVDALYFGYTSQGQNIQAMYSAAIQEAIEQQGCNSVGLILVGAFDQAQRDGLQGLFTLNLERSSNISQCLQVGYQMQTTVNILTELSTARTSATIMFNALQNGQLAGLSDAFTGALDRNQSSELQSALSLVLTQMDLNISAFVEAFSDAFEDSNKREQVQLAQILSNVLTTIDVTDEFLANLLYTGLANNETNPAFLQVVLESIEGAKCPLEDAVDTVAQRSVEDDNSPIFQLLQDNAEFRKCVTGQTLVKVFQQLRINFTFAAFPEPYLPEKGALQLFNSLERGSIERASTLLQEFITEQQANRTELAMTLTLLLTSPEIDLSRFAQFFANAAQSEVGEEILIAFQGSISDLSSEVELLSQLLETAFADNSTQAQFVKVILGAIEGEICELRDIFDAIVRQSGNESLVTQQIYVEEQLQTCISEDTLLDLFPSTVLFNSSVYITRLLQAPSTTAEIVFSLLEDGKTDEFSSLLEGALVGNGTDSLVEIFEFLFDTADFDVEFFFTAILQFVEDSPDQIESEQFLSTVFSQMEVNLTQLGEFLELGLTQLSSQEFFIQIILNSVKDGVCELGEALTSALTQAKQNDDKLYQVVFQNPELQVCVDNATLISDAFMKTFFIASQLQDNPQAVVDALLTSLQNGSVDDAASLLEDVIEVDLDATQIVVTLSLLLTERQLDIENLVLSIALALQRVDNTTDLEQALVSTFVQQGLNTSIVDEIMDAGLNNNATAEEFIQIALGSIEGETCQLKDSVDYALQGTNVSTTLVEALFEDAELQKCVEQDTLSTATTQLLNLNISLVASQIFQTPSVAADIILQQIQDGSVDDVSNLVANAFEEDANFTQISETFSLVFSQPGIDIETLALAIGLALDFTTLDTDAATTFSLLLQDEAQMNISVVLDLIQAGLTNNQTQEAFIQVILGSIEGEECGLGDVLDSILQQQQIGTALAQQFIKYEDLRRCVSEQTYVDVTTQLLSVNIEFATTEILQNSSVASQIIFDSLEKGSIETVSSLIVNAVEEQQVNVTDVSGILELVLSQPQVDVNNFALAIGIALDFASQQTELTSAVIDLLFSDEVNDTTRIDILETGLSNNQTLDAYIQVVLGSIEDDVCRLREEFDNATQNINIDEELSFYLQEYPELELCLSQQMLINIQTQFSLSGSTVSFGFTPAPEQEELEEFGTVPSPEEDLEFGYGSSQNIFTEGQTFVETPSPEEEQFGIFSIADLEGAIGAIGQALPAPENEIQQGGFSQSIIEFTIPAPEDQIEIGFGVSGSEDAGVGGLVEDTVPIPEPEIEIGSIEDLGDEFTMGISAEFKAASEISFALQNASVEVAADVLSDALLQSNQTLSATISLLFDTPDVNTESFVLAFNQIINTTGEVNSTVYTNALSEALVSQSINLTIAIDILSAGINNQETADAFIQVVLDSISGGVCGLEDAFTEVVQSQSNNSILIQELENNTQLQDCVEESVLTEVLVDSQELTLSFNISTFSEFAQPQFAAEAVFTQLEEGSVDTVSNFISQAADETNEDLNLTATFDFLFTKPEVNVNNFVSAFGSAVNSSTDDNQAVLKTSLTKALTTPTLNVSVAGNLLDVGLSNNNTAETFVQVVLGSIEGNICLLQDAMDTAVSQSKEDGAIRRVIQQTPDLQRCVSERVLSIAMPAVRIETFVSPLVETTMSTEIDLEESSPEVDTQTQSQLSLSFQIQSEILQNIANSTQSAQIIFEAANSGEAGAISAAIQLALEQGQIENITDTLDIVLSSEDIDTSTLTVSFGLLLQEFPETLPFVTDILTESDNYQLLVDIFAEGLVEAPQEFVQVVKNSIQVNDDVCVLQPIIESVVRQDSSLLSLFESDADLERCVVNFIIAPAPEVELEAPLEMEVDIQVIASAPSPTLETDDTDEKGLQIIVPAPEIEDDDIDEPQEQLLPAPEIEEGDIEEDFVGFTPAPEFEKDDFEESSLAPEIEDLIEDEEQEFSPAPEFETTEQVLSDFGESIVPEFEFNLSPVSEFEEFAPLPEAEDDELVEIKTAPLPEAEEFTESLSPLPESEEILPIPEFEDFEENSPQPETEEISPIPEIEDFEEDSPQPETEDMVPTLEPVPEIFPPPSPITIIQSQIEKSKFGQIPPAPEVEQPVSPQIIIIQTNATDNADLDEPAMDTVTVIVFQEPELEIVEPPPPPFLQIELPPQVILPPPPLPLPVIPSMPTPKECPRTELLVELSNGKQYLYGDHLRYEDALAACICIDADLVAFGTASEEQLVGAAHEIHKIQKLILGEGDLQTRYWTGLHNPSGVISLDGWEWHNETEVLYENWKWDQPNYVNNSRKEQCGEADANYQDCSGVIVQNYLAWGDASCQTYQQYICERQEVPRLQTIQQQVEFLYVPDLDRSYIFLTERKYSFYSAKRTCEDMKGQMVQFRSRVEEDLVYGALATVLPEYAVRPIWIGLEREETECVQGCNACECGQTDNCDCPCDCDLKEGDFYWVSGRLLGPYLNWMGNPCSFYEQQCLPSGRCVLTQVKKTPYTIQGHWTPHTDCGMMAYAMCEMDGVYYP